MSTAGKIGNREIVGFGLNGEPSYIDRLERPMPAIRFKENTPDIQVLFIISVVSQASFLWVNVLELKISVEIR